MASVNINIKVDTSQAIAAIKRLETVTRNIDTNVKKYGNTAQKSFANTEKSAKRAAVGIEGIVNQTAKLSRSIVIATGVAFAFRALTSAAQGVFDSFTEFEDALIGVGKTANLTDAELKSFGDEILDLAQDIPVASSELADLAKTAGQLGVRGSRNLTKFAETAARLASATNVSAETAVTGLTRIIRLTGDSEENIDRLGAALVGLGNTFNANEDEILSAALALSQSTSGFNIASESVLAFATTIKEAGLGSQKAATAIAGTLTDIAKSISTGGKAAANFGKLVGLTLEEVSELINRDAGEAFNLLVQRLGETTTSTTDLQEKLVSLGISEKRELQVIQALVRLRDTQTRALSASADEYERNGALIEESNRAFATLSSQAAKAGEAFRQLGIVIGDALSPALNTILDQTALVLNYWTSLARQSSEVKDETESLNDALVKLGIEGLTPLADGTYNPDDLNNALAKLQEKGRQTRIEFTQLGQTTFFGVKARDEAIKNIEDTAVAIENARNLILELQAEAGKAVNEATNVGNVEAQISETNALIDAFAEASKEREIRLAEEKELRENEEITNRLDRLATAFGEEEALRVASQAKELTQRGEHEKAKQLLTQRFRDADIKNFEQAEAAKTVVAKKAGALRNSAIGKVFDLGAALAKDGSKEQFLIQKAGALAQVAINDGIARSAALKQTAAIPYPANLGALAQLNSLITTNTALSTAIIAASAIKGYQNGGIVPGTSFSGDNVAARVNSGEMILNRQQQAQLFAVANGQENAPGTKEVVVHTTVELDGEAIGKSVSRQVADGLELGEVF